MRLGCMFNSEKHKKTIEINRKYSTINRKGITNLWMKYIQKLPKIINTKLIKPSINIKIYMIMHRSLESTTETKHKVMLQAFLRLLKTKPKTLINLMTFNRKMRKLKMKFLINKKNNKSKISQISNNPIIHCEINNKPQHQPNCPSFNTPLRYKHHNPK